MARSEKESQQEPTKVDHLIYRGVPGVDLVEPEMFFLTNEVRIACLVQKVRMFTDGEVKDEETATGAAKFQQLWRSNKGNESWRDVPMINMTREEFDKTEND